LETTVAKNGDYRLVSEIGDYSGQGGFIQSLWFMRTIWRYYTNLVLLLMLRYGY